MKKNSEINSIFNKYYTRTYGKHVIDKPKEKSINFDSYRLMSMKRKQGESLPPIIKKALDYLYPVKNIQESEPQTDYDKVVRKLSEPNFVSNESIKLRPIRRKKRSVEDVHTYRSTSNAKSNSQEYINCICYNGQAESEYMLTKQGIQEYTSLYNLYLHDSGLSLDRKRTGRSARKVSQGYFFN
jgi:hypothetical protein